MASKRSGEDGNNGHAADGDASNAKKAKSALPAGTLLFSGATDWEEVGRKNTVLTRSPNTVWTPQRLAALLDVKVESVASGPSSVHIFAVTDSGLVYGWGRNEKGQLGLGDTKDRKCPTLVKELSGHRIVAAATGRNHSLFLTDQGTVLACGDNKCGQSVNKGSTMTKVPALVTYDGPEAKTIACGSDFSAILDVQGSVWMWGHPEYGQLGNNTEGRYIEKAGKDAFHFEYEPQKVSMFVEKDPRSKAVSPVLGVTIKDIACGNNHTVAMDDKFRAFSWGFGGYGRLGHSETGNELLPRLIKFLDGPRRGIRTIYAGGQFNLAGSEIPGTTYMWGQYTSSKEANMYPKPIADLSGWMTRSVACSGKGWMVAADESVIACAPSPCFGELAMGENKKSSANPVEVTKLDKLYIHSVGMGVACSLFIARNDKEEDKKALEKYEILDQSDLDK